MQDIDIIIFVVVAVLNLPKEGREQVDLGAEEVASIMPHFNRYSLFFIEINTHSFV